MVVALCFSTKQIVYILALFVVWQVEIHDVLVIGSTVLWVLVLKSLCHVHNVTRSIAVTVHSGLVRISWCTSVMMVSLWMRRYELRSNSGMMRTLQWWNIRGILDGTIGGTGWDWGIVGMPNWVAGPERLMGSAGRARTMGGTAKAQVIVGFVGCNWEHACISRRIDALYWFKALFWNRSCEDTDNVEEVIVPDARARTVAVRRAGGRINAEL